MHMRHVFSSPMRSLRRAPFLHTRAGIVRSLSGIEATASTRTFSILTRQYQQNEGTNNNTENGGSEKADESNNEQQDTQNEEQTNSRIEELESRIKELEKKYLMSLAETENTRRIAKADIEKAKNYSLSNFTKQLLDVADNLERAMTVIDLEKIEEEVPEERPRKKVTTLLQGIKMTHNILLRVFKNHGIEKIPNPLGQKFDPKYHDAISQQPDPSQPSGTVSYIISEGYMIKDRVLRATSVAVVVNEDEDLPTFDESDCFDPSSNEKSTEASQDQDPKTEKSEA